MVALFVSACVSIPATKTSADPTVETLLLAMRDARYAGDIEGCVDLGNQALLISPGDTRILGTRARCLAELERAVDAMADIQKIQTLGPMTAFVLDDVALAYLALGRPEDAAAAAGAALAMDPTLEDAHFDLISALMAAGKYQEAIAAFDVFKVACLEDRNGVANNLAWELYLAGHYAEALQIAEEWLAANPTPINSPNHIANPEGYAKVLDTAAHSRAALGQADEAVAAFLSAADMSPDELRPLYQELLTAQGFAQPGDPDLEPALRACVAGGENCRLYVDFRRSGPLAPPV